MPVHLEDGLFRLCGDLIAQDGDFRAQAVHRNFNEVDDGLFREYRLYRLKKTVAYAYGHSRFYRDQFDRLGLCAEMITGMEDLQRFPFTAPEDLSGNSYAFLCTSQSEVEKPVTYTSTGTTGLQKRIFFSRRDMANIRKFLAVGMNTVADPGETAQIILPNSRNRGTGAILAGALQELGMRAYATDMSDDSARQVRRSMENRPAVWFGDAGTIYRITKEMEGKVDLAGLGVRVLFLTMGQVSPVMRRYLERIWSCRVCTHYGLTEVGWGLAVDCAHSGKYHYNELDVIAEVIDPVTGQPLPDGLEGELVYTCIGREAMPLIRYRSRDIAALTSKTCACGRHLQTMGHVERRMEAAATLPGGTELYPALFHDTLYSFPQVVDYNIFIDRREEVPLLRFEVETLARRSGLREEMEKSIATLPALAGDRCRVEVALLEAGTLKKSCYEKKLIREARYSENI